MRRALACAALVASVLFPAESPRAQDIPIISPRFGAPEAPSAITVRFLAESRPTVAVLDRASALAATHAGTRRVRTFARREAATFSTILNALEAAAAPPLVGGDPLDTAAVAASSVDAVAETVLSGLPPLAWTPGARAVAANRAITSQGETDLARLGAFQGPEFDTLYDTMQREGLARLVALFRDYVQNGDDSDLRAVAVHALPGLRVRLEAMRVNNS